MEIKRGVIFTFAFFALTILIIGFVSAVGIVPARREIDFRPGLERTITYRVSNPNGKTTEVFAQGGLAEYITFTKDKIPGGNGEFNATIKLPGDLELEPGKHNTYIGAREEVDKELGGFISVQAIIKALVQIDVPYPGKYVESHISTQNVNINEPMEFNLEMIGRGDEDVLTRPKIEIYSENHELIEVLEFRERELQSQEKISLKKPWETEGESAGKYYAVSIIEYNGQSPSEDRVDFRIGELSLNLVNHTENIVINGMQGFELEVQSGWNDRIDGAYAEVVFLNSSEYFVKPKPITSFKTSPTDLDPWEKETISGYFNSSLFVPGEYDANVTLVYYGRERGISESQIISVGFAEKDPEPNYVIWGSAIIGLSLLIAVILFLLFKDEKKK